jgi:hypothetical protein
MKSVLLSYLLWLLGGFFGLHKFYLERPLMGLFYCCSGGGFFIGWVIDFFTLPRQVQIANLLLQNRSESPSAALQREFESLKRQLYTLLNHDSTRSSSTWRASLQQMVKPRPADEELMLGLLRAAQKHGGRLSVTAGVLETGMPFAEVERVLKAMTQSGYVYVDNDPTTGVVVYIFKELF